MHAKLIVADGTLGFVGSENFSATSLDENREVGLLIADTSTLATLNSTFQSDWSNATAACDGGAHQETRRTRMVTEIAQFRAQPGKAEALQAGLVAGMAVIRRAEGMRAITLRRALEDADLFIYEVEWETLEHHTVQFRGGPLFAEYRSHIAGLFVEPVSVTHYARIDG